MSIDIAVVPVAGLGTRMLPATKSQPKEMLPVGRKPVVQYVVEELTRAGMGRILFITGQGKTSIENHFDVNAELVQALRESGKEDLLAELAFERSPVQYFYTRQRQALGLGHAVLSAQSLVRDEPFVVALGDSIIGFSPESDVVRRMTTAFTARGAAAVIALEEVAPQDARHYGIAQVGEEQGELLELTDLIEKPDPEEAPSNLAIAGRYVLSPAIFPALVRTKAGRGVEIQLTDAIRALIRSGERVYGMKLRQGERRFDIGNFDAYFRAFVEFAIADEKHGDAFRRFLAGLHANHP
jgi:UTP--glucose-1-phosphate uridylyltransferase